MKVSAEGPSCMAVAAAWHWRVITDCQTEDFKLIHMIENIGAMRREFIKIFYFPGRVGDVLVRERDSGRSPNNPTCKTHFLPPVGRDRLGTLLLG